MLVLISTTGWQNDLTIKAAVKSKADKIILVTCAVKKGTPVEDADKFVKKLAKESQKELNNFFETEIVEVDYSDYQDAFEKISTIVKKEKTKGNKVQLNITEGSKLTAAAMMSVAFMQNVEVLYFIPKKYNFELLPKDKPLREGIWKGVKISPLPGAFKISKKAEKILGMMQNSKMTVKDYIQKFKSKDENRARAEFNYYINKLKNYGLVEAKGGVRTNNYFLTESGKMILKSL